MLWSAPPASTGAACYAGFGDKRGLFLESLRRYDRRQREEFLARLAERHTPREAILAAFDAAAHGAQGAPGGCLLVNTALEVSPHDAQVRELVNSALAAVRGFFRDMVRQGQQAGELSTTLDAEETAEALLGLFLGLRVLHRSEADPAMREAVASRARTLLE
ncbi:MAG: TetR family transcriptional regulator C-terminal domain-containing protein [Arhodomonas sp.]|nr:TetR family transcriptional regulator C-terminal domain-containing protein [Arhodomonas sp.]